MKNKESSQLKSKRNTDFLKKRSWLRDIGFEYHPLYKNLPEKNKLEFLESPLSVDIGQGMEEVLVSFGTLNFSDKDGQDFDRIPEAFKHLKSTDRIFLVGVESKTSTIGSCFTISYRYENGIRIKCYGESKTSSKGEVGGLRSGKKKKLKNADLCLSIYNVITDKWMFYYIPKKIWQSKMVNKQGMITFRINVKKDPDYIKRFAEHRKNSLKELANAGL
jgi:hypothetical protein